jgi:hypothetical protein
MAITRKDLLLDLETGNLLVKNGDLVIGDSVLQEAITIMRANQGDYKQFPLVGCNLTEFTNAQGRTADIERIIRKQLEVDGISEADIKKILEING